MMGEYPDVFLEDLSRLPPDKEIKICIDLGSRAQPVSITPYKMTPAKLTKLRKQLNELLEEGLLGAVLFHKDL